MKCLYDRAKRLVTKPSVISEEKKHLHLSLTDIPLSLCIRSTRQEQPPEKSQWQNSSSPPFFPTYREYRSVFNAALNNKAFAPRLHIRNKLRSSTRLNKMAWFTGFPVNSEKSTSGKRGDLCMRESKSMTGICDSPLPRPPPFLCTSTRPAIISALERRKVY